jgi:superfamily II DNA or RNA helicase/HKD family nuclease
MAHGIRGLYEVLITEALAARLRDQESSLEVIQKELRAADAADRLAFHLERLIRRALSAVDEEQRVAEGVELAQRLIAHIDAAVSGARLAGEAPVAPGTVLRALLGRRPDGTGEPLPEPLIPLLDTALLTNAPGEPRVGNQILAEIPSADRIDVVMAFVRWTGLYPLLDALRRHCERGATLRVLTTTYTGSTEARALDELRRIGAETRVSYDTRTTRLHAKAWLFYRSSGFSTAYVGSSNLTYSAQVSGLEWNVRVSGARNPDVVDKIAAVFESYWNSGDFEPYEREVFLQRRGRDTTEGPEILLSPIELRLEPFQERLLEQIELARQQGHHRNLLVSATGTGKTVMAAVDYARLRDRLPRGRLLVVAHREEILTQSLATFRHALRDASFGELWVGGRRPERFEHVFASIQSLHAADLGHIDPEHFDVVIVDEFHHAAAPSYDRLLSHLRPRELLGLTATPERSDGLSLLHWFDGRTAAELRLWDAIDQHRLTPFVYYGISDGLDLREVPWRRGRGYDVEGLEKLYTGNDAWARLVLEQLRRRIDNVSEMRALGFCVSIEHARFMARVFRAAGIAATAVWADTPPDARRAALLDLHERRIQVLFSIDLFNEGVDLPAVDTLLLLRPTDSPTLFLQQLGRGLRRSRGKTVCTVLDFVGQHRKEFRFDRRLRALLGGNRKEVAAQVERGFPFLPAGCHMELDPVAREVVLRSIRAGISAKWTAKIEELRLLARTGKITLARYLEETGLEVDEVYGGSKTWSDLQARAGVSLLPAGPSETELRRACSRLLHVDDLTRIAAWREMVSREQPPDAERLGAREQRLLRMLVASVCEQALTKGMTLAEGVALLWAHPQVRAELLELLDVLATRIGHLHRPLATADVPLEVHARYSRIEILAAFGVGDDAKVAPWQTGVYWVGDARADLLAFTLDKTSGAFSPTTRYRDYAISRELIHWESQSTTRADGDTGRRYRDHARMGSAIMLFARLRSDDRAFWFLGPATYVRHEGELPMAITWRLAHPLPGDLFATFAAAVA